MKVFSILFVLGVIDACLARSMQPLEIKKRFQEAKYAFKFRVTSKSSEKCFPDSFAVTTPEATTASATLPTTAISTTDPTKRRMTTDLPSRPSTVITLTEATTETVTRKKVEELATDGLTTVEIRTAATATKEKFLTDAPVVITEGNSVKNSSVTHENRSRELKTIQSQNEQQTTLPPENNLVNTSESAEPSRSKRSCRIKVYHQDIMIGRKHIYKACNEINGMKRVQGMDEKYLKSTIRLQLGFSELKPNRNYFFMGRAAPGQDPSDYVFIADELTVVNWKTGAWKLKKHLRSNGGRCN